jgi:NTE family protein
MVLRNKRLGVALGGGGARGLAHIGVLRVFEEEAIQIDIIAGSSIGALVASAFANGMKTEDIENKTKEFLESSTFENSALKSIKEVEAGETLSLTQKIQAFFKNQFYLAKAIFRPGMLQSEDFQAMIDYFVPDIDIQDTKIPLRVVTTDLLSGHPVVFSEGSLRETVMASCSVPGAVPPYAKNGMLLSDGGIACLVPTSVIKEEQAEFIVAVDVSSDIKAKEEFRSAIDVYVRSSNILSHHLVKRQLEEADVVIRPRVGQLHWTDFLKATDLVQAGEAAGREQLGEILKAFPFYRRWPMINEFVKKSRSRR